MIVREGVWEGKLGFFLLDFTAAAFDKNLSYSRIKKP
jgi:hypothetical protein